MIHEIKTFIHCHVISNMIRKLFDCTICILVLKLSFVSAHHMIQCANSKECYAATEVCVNGECAPICVDDNSCPSGFVCNSYKARLVIFT